MNQTPQESENGFIKRLNHEKCKLKLLQDVLIEADPKRFRITATYTYPDGHVHNRHVDYYKIGKTMSKCNIEVIKQQTTFFICDFIRKRSICKAIHISCKLWFFDHDAKDKSNIDNVLRSYIKHNYMTVSMKAFSARTKIDMTKDFEKLKIK